ncbi:MAG: hypothetical protein JST84_14780 [Acidobacteria bacterium]|nr:hypothetical protein [Acidobacteriota bacterium]
MENLTTTRICYKCDYETRTATETCPNCGHRLRTAQQIRMLGWLLTAIGGGLTVCMALLTVAVAGIMVPPFNRHASTRFTGGPEAALLIFSIFGFVMLFGLTSVFAGIWQIRYGRRNKHLTAIILTLAVVFIVLGVLVQILL